MTKAKHIVTAEERDREVIQIMERNIHETEQRCLRMEPGSAMLMAVSRNLNIARVRLEERNQTLREGRAP